MYVQVQLPVLVGASSWVDYIGLRVLADVEIEIGGQRIDKHYSQWMYIWNELSLPVGKQPAWKKMVGSEGNNSPVVSGSTGYNCFVPLEFWFNRNVGLALPLIALQYHEVKINIDYETLTNCIGYANGNLSTPTIGAAGTVTTDLVKSSIWVDYIYLDTDERRRFAQLSHEYLIEQLQFTGDESITDVTSTSAPRIKMNFNHPVKELIWVAQADARVGAGSNNWTNFATDTSAFSSTTATANAAAVIGTLNSVEESASTNIQLNGQDRFYAREGSYFNLVQPYQHHERAGNNPGVNVYSFALKPEEHQPSGTLNFSRIDTAYLNVKLAAFKDANGSALSAGSTGKLKVFAVNYNVLRIMSGMGGLAYSN
jgi:hypothetical protein